MDVRSDIDRLIAAADAHAASRRLRELWTSDRSPASAAFVVSRYEKVRDAIGCIPYRVAILRSFTVEPAVPLLRAEAFTFGIDLTVHVGDFNAYAQEVLDAESSVYRFAPDAVVVAVLASDIAPDLTREFADLDADAVDAAVARVSHHIEDAVRAFRSHSRAHLIVHTLERPAVPSLGVLDAQTNQAQSAAIDRINQRIRQLAAEHRGVYVLDYDELVARHGRGRWTDARKWLIARMPVAADRLIDLAREWIRFLVPLSGKTAKALVVDLDNTLWGGVIGEDGIGGIRLGAEYPGAAFQAVQRAMLDLSRKGILLAICSKNNPDDAMEVLRHHPGMLLRPEHFAATRINWNDKSQNLRELAEELNVGVDALAFMDDSPVECEQIRTALPDVTVIQLSGDPLTYAAALRDCPVFERVTVSAEDSQRTGMYAAQRERAQAEQTFTSKEDFYRFLHQEAEIAPVQPHTLARVAQLTQKTNQFNVTTRRYSEQQIADMAARFDHQVLSVRVRDRYGDHGLVGVAIARDSGLDCEIDTFLLSCRVIGRTVETALLSVLAESARARNRRRLVGRFIPTKKNAPAASFFAQHGFRLDARNGDETVWALDLAEHTIACPEWISLNVLQMEKTLDIDGIPAG